MMIDSRSSAAQRRQDPADALPGLSGAIPSHHDDHMAALMGTLPIALGFGAGAESRRPLGVSSSGLVSRKS